MKQSIGVVIVGGSGYGAGELLRYLTFHPAVSVVGVVSSSHAGEVVTSVHRQLSGFYDQLCFCESVPWKELATYDHPALFLALPHGHAGTWLKEIPTDLEARLKVIDLAADYRIGDRAVHESTYPEIPYDAEQRGSFVYGLPEVHGAAIARAGRVANPGCLATAALIAAVPLVRNFGADLQSAIVFDAKTGTSGAGRAVQDSMHHPHRADNVAAYKVLAHRHEPEIVSVLAGMLPHPPSTIFVPHLLPLVRGIFVTMYAELGRVVSVELVREQYREFYRAARFVRFRADSPELHDVQGTNFVDVAVAVRGRQVVVMAALDNLGKGMAGQAIQNMNCMVGLPEHTGLLVPALGPT